jgi:toxin secretion/phage lysis holin
MVNYLDILKQWMDQPHYLLIVLIMVYIVAGTVDFLAGTFNAAYSKDVQFSSRTAQLGIVRKLVTLIIMILIIPLALILPYDVAIYSLSFMYVGIVSSEIYSIAGHVGIVKDGDKHKNLLGTLLNNFIDSIYKNKGMK